MPPRSFVSSVYCASPGERRSRSFESTPCRNACAPSPADLHLAHVRDVEDAGRRAHARAPRRSRPRTGPASPNRRRGRGARPTPRGVRTAACAAARPAPRGLYPSRPARAHEADLVGERVGGARLVARSSRRSSRGTRTRRAGACASSRGRPSRRSRARRRRGTCGRRARTSSASASAPVSRFEVGQISSTMPVAASSAVSSGSPAARMPWPMRSGRSASTTSPTSSAKPSSPQCTVTPRPASRASCTSGASGA